MQRRNFLSLLAALGLSATLPVRGKTTRRGRLQTVKGWIDRDNTGRILEHEHVMVDFIGAGKVSASRYNPDEVFEKVIPYLKELKDAGFDTFIECTPQFLGRDVKLLRRLSDASGLNIITNTGLYGTQNGKYLPSYAFSETAEQLAKRWITEWEEGIDGTGIKPGFIKISVDKAPIRDFQQKIVKAAAITHLETGLTIASHTGEAAAALEQLDILKKNHVHPSAFIWVHAQSEKDPGKHLQVVGQGAWASYDGAAWEKPGRYLELIDHLKKNRYLDHVLISHDAGWYHVGEPGGGEFKGFTGISKKLIPLLKDVGYKDADIEKLLTENPANAFEIRVRKIKS